MADTVEVEVKKKLEDVTKRLLRREAELQFARSEEGKQLTAQIKNAEVRLKLEEKSLETKDKISIVEAEIAEAQKELSESREVEHDILVKREKELAKVREKQRKKAAAEERKYFRELLSSLNPFKMLGKAMGSFIPKPIKILGSWGAHLSKKWGGRMLRGMGRMVMKGGRAGIKGIASVIRGKSPAEVEAAPETVPETEAVPRKTTKLDPKAFLLTSKTQPLYEDGETPETAPEEGILGKAKAGAGKFMGGIGGAVDRMFGEPEPVAAEGESIETPQDGFGLLHTDLVGIHGLLETFTNAATTEGSIFVHDARMGEKMDEQTDELVDDLAPPKLMDSSVQRESDIESKIPFLGGKKKKGKKGKGFLGTMVGAVTGGLGIQDAMGSMIGTAFGPKIASAVGTMGAVMLPAAVILWGVTSAAFVIKDFISGYKSGGATGGIAKAIGGEAKGGMWSGAKGAMKWAGIGAMAGLAVGGPAAPITMLVGALIGAAFGGLMGWIGSEKIKKALDNVSDWFGFEDPMSQEEKDAHDKRVKEINARIEQIKKPGGLMDKVDEQLSKFEEMKATGTQLTGDQMQALDVLYTKKAALQDELIALEISKQEAAVETEREKMLQLRQEHDDAQKRLAAMTTATVHDEKGRMVVGGEVGLLEQKIRDIKLALKQAEKDENTTLVDMYQNRLDLANLALTNKKAEAEKLKEDIKAKADALYAEQKKLDDAGLLTGWEEFTFDLKTAGREIKANWAAFSTNIAQMATDFSAWIYTPGTPGPKGRPAEMFGVELKWPEFDIPSWGDIKEALPAWLKADWWTTKWDGWMMVLPTWSDILASIPKWLGGTKEGTSSWSELLDFSEWKLPEWPTWKTIKSWMPEWMTDPVGWIKGIFSRGDEAADIEEKLREGTEKKKKLEDRKASVREEAQGARKQASGTLQFQRNVFTQRVTDVEAELQTTSKKSGDKILAMQEAIKQSDLFMETGGKQGTKLQSYGAQVDDEKDMTDALRAEIKKEQDKIIKAVKAVTDVTAHAKTETARLDDLESVAHGKITANETVKMAELDAESLVLQQEQTEHERKLATLVNNSVPHIKVMSIVDPADLGSTATILGAGAGGGGNAVVVNNITNAMGGSTSAPTSVTNMNIMAGANDPHTSKQPNHLFGHY